jgi:hypothetical protein
MKSRCGYKGYVIEARSHELRDGGFSAEFSIEEHDGGGGNFLPPRPRRPCRVPLKQMVLKTPSPESHCAGIKTGDERPAPYLFNSAFRFSR